MKKRTLEDALREVINPDDEALSEKYLVTHLFEDAKYFLERGKEYEQTNVLILRRYLRAAVISAFAGLEAFVNTLCEISAENWDGDWGLSERALVEGRRVEFADEGYFEIRGTRIYSLEEKLKFFHWRVHGLPISDNKVVWKAFLDAKKYRNKLVHPSQGKISYSGHTVRAATACVIAVFKVAAMIGWPKEDSAGDTS
jgi:hypothetical protein